MGRDDSHLARTSSPWDSVEICKVSVACRFFSLSFVFGSLGGLQFHFFSATHATPVNSPGKSAHPQMLSP